MDQKEFDLLQVAIDKFFKLEEIDVLDEVDPDSEPSFSWGPCDCCGSHLGGDRFDMLGFNSGKPDAEQYKYSICVDCYFAVNGILEVDV